MEYEHSHKVEAALAGWPQTEALDAADAYVVSEADEELLCFESGFNLAMKSVQMSALARYSGKNIRIFCAKLESDKPICLFFLGLDEDEIVARLAPNP